ncbi:MAG: chemotaxis-specific protein-glutamate methyltransferase CheB [Nitrospirales bacterium]
MSTPTLPIRVLVVDDSMFMRNTLSTMLMKYPDVQVVGTAKNGHEALLQVKRVAPDVMTLDVDMPEMNGLEVLDRIMTDHPIPIVMVSSLTHEGAEETFQALACGAFDFIPKQQRVSTGDLGPLEARLYEKIKSAFDNKARFLHSLRKKDTGLSRCSDVKLGMSTSVSSGMANGVLDVQRGHASIRARKMTVDLLIIGGSTGAPQVLFEMFRHIPESFPLPILIVQHMPKFFTTVFAAQLAKCARISVREGRDGDILEAGKAIIAPGDHHVAINRDAQGLANIKISDEPRDRLYWPCIDLALSSAAKHYGERVLALILTGMGRDGLVGCQQIKARGGKVLVQDEQSSMVFGMNRAVWEAGFADEMITSSRMGQCLMEIVGGYVPIG